MWKALLAVLCLLSFAPSIAGAATGSGYNYLDPSKVDLIDLLPPPPDPNSAEQQADERKVAAIVGRRTPGQLSDAMDESERDVFFFAPSVGAGFAPESLPKLTSFFERVSSDVRKLVETAKAYWQRPRPPGMPVKHGSYPSGHAAFAASTAIILSEMVPEKRNVIFTQARVFSENRIILGVHYPTDVASGWIAGTLAVAQMMNDKRYRADFAAAKAELRHQVGLANH